MIYDSIVEVRIMIKRFTVENFRNFKNRISLDFSNSHEYDFNKSFVKEGLINKSLIYGRNSSGKSNFGFAIMDITSHLTDNPNNSPIGHYTIPINLSSNKREAYFEYVFQFGEDEITYKYVKDTSWKLIKEEILLGNRTVFFYDYINSVFSNEIDEINSVNLENRNQNISVIKYIRNNTLTLSPSNPIKLIVDFANNMLWFRSLKINEYIGTNHAVENIAAFIIGNNLIDDFNIFLKKNDIDEQVQAIQTISGPILGTKKGTNVVDFFSICSTGTVSLSLFYYWLKKSFSTIKFLFMDEFDAFYHPRLSKAIIDLVNENQNFQSIVTTHNYYLASNSIMRPDCYFIIKNGEIKSFADRHEKAIREGNNITKMMMEERYN